MADPSILPDLPGYFWGNAPNINQQLRQRIALQMMSSGKKGFPKTLGEGLSAIGDAIGDRGLAKMLEQSDLAAQASAAKLAAPRAQQTSEAAPGEAAPAQPVAYAPTGGDVASAPPVRAIDAAAGGEAAPPAAPTEVSDGGYNFIDAQAGGRFKPTPGYLQDAIAAREPNPDMQAYFGDLSATEAPKGARDVSSTGAAGPYQFTRGTGAQYGVPGDARLDPGASTDAVRKFTADNAAIFQRINGRPPTFQELALMHQQGGTTGAKMVAGTGNAPPGNLAVNNVPPGASPSQAVAKINRFYGMPNETAPVGNARANAAAVLSSRNPMNAMNYAPPSAPGVPSTNPTQPGPQTPTIPNGLGAIGAGSPPEAAGNAPIATDIRPMPAAPIPRPGVQMAQAQPQAIPGYVTPQPTDPTGAPIVPMSPREIQINRILAANQGNPYVAPALAAELGQLQTERTTRQSEANQLYKAKVEQQTKLVEMRQTQLADQAKRQQDYAKQAQGLIAGGLPGAPGAPSAAGQAVDPRLGTPLSPQRSGIPTVPPVPPGITPDKWNEQQAPEMTKAIVAYEKAVPAFEEAVKTLRLARDHPGKEWGVGPLSGYAKKMPGTAAYGFGTIMDQIAGKNFLNAYQQLKGGGAITEIEGSKAEQAQARLATAQTKEDFDKALNDFESNLRQDLETVQRKVNRPVTSWRPPNDNVSTAPDIGQRRGNKEYIGGNPADPMSWRPAQ